MSYALVMYIPVLPVLDHKIPSYANHTWMKDLVSIFRQLQVMQMIII